MINVRNLYAMNKGKIEQSLSTMLKEFQVGAGEPAYEVTPATLEERYGARFDANSIFTDKKNCGPLTVSQIAERILTGETDDRRAPHEID